MDRSGLVGSELRAVVFLARWEARMSRTHKVRKVHEDRCNSLGFRQAASLRRTTWSRLERRHQPCRAGAGSQPGPTLGSARMENRELEQRIRELTVALREARHELEAWRAYAADGQGGRRLAGARLRGPIRSSRIAEPHARRARARSPPGRRPHGASAFARSVMTFGVSRPVECDVETLRRDFGKPSEIARGLACSGHL